MLARKFLACQLSLTFLLILNTWTASSEFGTYRLCEQRRFRRACASAQSRQNLRRSLIQAVSQEEPSDRKPDPWSLWMAGHAQLKFVMTECSKTQNRLTRHTCNVFMACFINSFRSILIVLNLIIWNCFWCVVMMLSGYCGSIDFRFFPISDNTADSLGANIAWLQDHVQYHRLLKIWFMCFVLVLMRWFMFVNGLLQMLFCVLLCCILE